MQDGRAALRADARQNYDRILKAAAEVFVADGFNAPLDRIARHARVGEATLHRRFPTRDSLLRALTLDLLRS